MLATGKDSPFDVLENVLSAAFGLQSKEGKSLGLPDFPIDNLETIAKLLVI